MKIFVLILGFVALLVEGFGTLFAISAGGSPENKLVLIIPLVLIVCSLIGVIGMFRQLKMNRFWVFAFIGIGIPLIYWIYTIWPSGGFIKFLS